MSSVRLLRQDGFSPASQILITIRAAVTIRAPIEEPACDRPIRIAEIYENELTGINESRLL